MLMFLEGGGEFNPLNISTGFMFWSVITFAITLVVLTKFGWKPLMDSIDAREKKIRDDLEQAEKARAEAEELMKSNKEELAKAAVSGGMSTLQMDGVRKVVQGLTTFDEVLSITHRKDTTYS